MGPEQLLPHFPANAAGLAESISSVARLSPGLVLSNVAMPGEGEVGEGQVEITGHFQFHGVRHKRLRFQRGDDKGHRKNTDWQGSDGLSQVPGKGLYFLPVSALALLHTFPSFLIYDHFLAPLC